MTRAARAAEALRLRAQGLFYREIAERMGISVSYTAELCIDPDGLKVAARKESYRQPCVDCGALLNGSDGFGDRAPARCVHCAPVVSGMERKVWDREALIEAIQAFADEFGEPPASPDWNPSQCRTAFHDETRAARFEARDDWPSFCTVIREFGSWSAGLRAAGFTPRQPNGGGGNIWRQRRYQVAA